MRLKYIVLKGVDEHDGMHKTPILFPHVLVHAEVYKSLQRMREGLRVMECVSAGFVDIRAAQVSCFGRSESLNIDSAEGDAQLIEALQGYQSNTHYSNR